MMSLDNVIVSVGKVIPKPDYLFNMQLKMDMSYVYNQLKKEANNRPVEVSEVNVFKKMAYHYGLTMNEMYQNMVQYAKGEEQ